MKDDGFFILIAFYAAFIVWWAFMWLGFIVLYCDSCPGHVHQTGMTIWLFGSIILAILITFLLYRKIFKDS